MHIFVTGATGFIGGIVIEQAIAKGHSVSGLSRNEAGDATLVALGATPIRGDLTNHEALRSACANVDAVFHLAFDNSFGVPFADVIRVDKAAIDSMSESLRGTGKPFVVASGTSLVQSDPAGNETFEDSPLSTTFFKKDRILIEQHVLNLKEQNIRAVVVRFSPFVYGCGGGKGFLNVLIQAAKKSGESVYIDKGSIRTSVVHVEDVAALLILAGEDSRAIGVFNCSGSTSITFKDIAETIGSTFNLPVRSVSAKEAGEKLGFLAGIIQIENRASNRKAYEKLGWKPKGRDILSEIKTFSGFKFFPYRQVLVLGSTSGIGHEFALKLINNNISVILVGRRTEKLQSFSAKYPGKTTFGLPKVAFETFDLGNLDAIPAFASNIEKSYPQCDCIFYNAGHQRPFNFSAPTSVNLNFLDEEMKLNYLSPVHITTAFLPFLTNKKTPTALMYTTSGLAIVPMGQVLNYCASKAALHHFILALRESLDPSMVNSHLPKDVTIRVIELMPPLVQTELHDTKTHPHVPNNAGRHWGLPVNQYVDETWSELLKGSEQIFGQRREAFGKLEELRKSLMFRTPLPEV
ncbi:hypothetical protein HK096_005687 [Nowakowskiella sp. JEL0078]|nr:hypothetical protein HK096_005687 [Nowakowskiella sp. JEL0078]